MAEKVVSTQVVPPASGTTTPSGKPPETPTEPKPLTPDEIRAIAREEAWRTNQSWANKLENRVKAHLDTLKKSGVAVTPEQEQGIRRTISQEVTEEESKANSLTGQPVSAGDSNPVVQFVSGIMAEEGTTIEDADPEAAQVVEALRDPKATQHTIHKAVMKAIDAKRAREGDATTKAALRTPAGGGISVSSNDISTITDSAQLYELGEERIRKGQKA